MSATALSTELSSFRTAVAEAYQQRDDAKNEAKIKETLAKCSNKLAMIKTLIERLFSRVALEQLNVRKMKARSEKENFKLQNLLYEKNLLINEIQACENMDTPYRDLVALVDESVFKKDAPPELSDVDPVANPHQYLLNQLEYELLLRKQLSQGCEQQSIQLKEAENILHEKIKRVEDLRNHFKDTVEKVMALCDRVSK
jgi:hypothetical protein|eukprot:Stramenopile-MAST_4_protein_990